MSIFPRLAAIAAAAILSACASSRNLDESFSDLGGNAELKAVLFADRTHDYGDVDLTLYEGRLLLTGTMRSESGREKLIENAWKAENVKEVIDEIQIAEKTSFGQGFEDTRIDQTIRARLIAAEDVIASEYKLSVSKAVVYVMGSARDQAELDEALNVARSVAGVEKVVSYVTLRNPTM